MGCEVAFKIGDRPVAFASGWRLARVGTSGYFQRGNVLRRNRPAVNYIAPEVRQLQDAVLL